MEGGLSTTTQVFEPKSSVEASTEHTPIHFPFSDNIFNQEDNETNTLAVSEDLEHSPQLAVESRIQFSAATTVPALLNLGSLSSTRKLVQENVSNSSSSSFSSVWKQMRGNNVVASAEEEMSRAKRGEDLNSVQTLSDRQSLHEFLERKAESAAQGENSAPKRPI